MFWCFTNSFQSSHILVSTINWSECWKLICKISFWTLLLESLCCSALMEFIVAMGISWYFQQPYSYHTVSRKITESSAQKIVSFFSKYFFTSKSQNCPHQSSNVISPFIKVPFWSKPKIPLFWREPEIFSGLKWTQIWKHSISGLD